MLPVAYAFVLLMVCKDIMFAPYPYALRVIAQAGCLVAGLYWIFQSQDSGILRRYWPVWGYLLIIALGAQGSLFPWFVWLQAGSLASAILFAVGYVESPGRPMHERFRAFVVAAIVAYGIVCIVSLLLLKIRPGLVHGALFVGGSIGEELRFHGLMAKSSMIGAAAGLLLGFAALRVKPPVWKLTLCGAAATCVVLTQSRSFWIAAVIAGGCTLWTYKRAWRARVVGGSVVLATLATCAVVFGVTAKVDDFARFARLDTLMTMTGRTGLWAEALDSAAQRPLLGYGFTLGSSGLAINKTSNTWTSMVGVEPMELSRETLHNGYIQSLMDVGLLGLFFYLAAIVTALVRLLRADQARQYPELLYALLFLTVANVGESVIYSGSVFHSLCFWVCAIFAMSLRPSAVTAATQPRSDAATQAVGDVLTPNLMR